MLSIGDKVWYYESGYKPQIGIIKEQYEDMAAYHIDFLNSSLTQDLIITVNNLYAYPLDKYKLLCQIQKDISDLARYYKSICQEVSSV